MSLGVAWCIITLCTYEIFLFEISGLKLRCYSSIITSLGLRCWERFIRARFSNGFPLIVLRGRLLFTQPRTNAIVNSIPQNVEKILPAFKGKGYKISKPLKPSSIKKIKTEHEISERKIRLKL